MRVLDLLRQVYREIGMLETSRRQKDMIIADNAGVKAIRYEQRCLRLIQFKERCA